MKTNKSSLDSTSDHDSLHQQLHMYALAASAAGVTMLALAQPAQAEIVYTPTQVTIGPNQSYGLDLNNDGITDFTIVYQTTSASEGLLNLYVQNPGGGNAVAGFLANTGGFQWAYAFYSKFAITQAQRHFISSSRATMAWDRQKNSRWSVWGGSWAGSSFGVGVYDRYLGLKFEIKGKTHYGWAELDTALASWESGTVTLTGYAYETKPNKAIKTGQTQEDESAAPGNSAALTQPERTPATLGHLARGARALRHWRQQQKQSLAQDQSQPSEGR